MSTSGGLFEALRCLPAAHARCLWEAFGGARSRWDDWLNASGAIEWLVHGNALGNNLRGYEHWLKQPTTVEVRDQIEKDLHRSCGGENLSLDALRRVLCAHAGRNPQLGYTQGLNFIVVKFLETSSSSRQGHFPCTSGVSIEAETFWLLCAVTERLLPEHFEPSLIGVRTDTLVLDELLRAHPVLGDLPSIFEPLGLDLAIFTPQWFMLLFSDTLPAPSMLAIWDLFFQEGARVLLAAALAILGCQASRLRASRDDMTEVYTLLRTPDVPTALLIDQLLLELHALPAARLAQLRRVKRPKASEARALDAWLRALQGSSLHGLRVLQSGVINVGELTVGGMHGVGVLTGRSIESTLEFTGWMLKAGVEAPAKILFATDKSAEKSADLTSGTRTAPTSTPAGLAASPPPGPMPGPVPGPDLIL